MPFPLLIPIAVGVAGLFGVGKTIKSVVDSSEANSLDSFARDKITTAERKLDISRGEVNNCLTAYGQQKCDAVENNLHQFVSIFQRIKKVDFSDSRFEDRLVGDFDHSSFDEMKKTCELISAAAIGLRSGAATGALSALGAYGGTMLLASASTGTAISTLSGVAATNATLAWLGGGTLAAGGLGMAGGMMVLGVMVAGPALAIFGAILGANAAKKLSEAKANYAKSKQYESEIDLICIKMAKIKEMVGLISDVLTIVCEKSKQSNAGIQAIIDVCGEDYNTYNIKAQEAIFKAAKLAQLVKSIVDTSILNDKGDLIDDISYKITQLKLNSANL
ncbi:MAG: hypothetical protein LBR11_12565 [Deltaproteobacteria bacterium]|jgi:hypothetical protein|nr:hypothetical protein [Deltaproteobacteria bacterium]